jgi:transcription initiation factor TFIIIB Brf1 subunit/transcription initiation factor TFIIB
MLICLDCGKVLKNTRLDYSEESSNETIICPICESDNIWDEQLEMYINDNGTL